MFLVLDLLLLVSLFSLLLELFFSVLSLLLSLIPDFFYLLLLEPLNFFKFLGVFRL
jgi:hypothetical protein